MFGMFSNPKKPPVVPPPATDTAAVQDAAALARKRAVMAKGRASTDIVSKLGYVGA